MTFKKSIALLLSGSMLATAALTGCGSDNTAAAVSNTAGKDLLDQIQARGSITVASISVRKIVQTALNQNAASVVLAHNHPSGYALPSQEDLDTTRTLQTALQSVGIVLADHIIVADDDYVSLADDGYLGGSYGL